MKPFLFSFDLFPPTSQLGEYHDFHTKKKGEYHDKKRDLATLAKLPLSFSFVSVLQKVKLHMILYHILLS